jgi:ADP-dependent NAD(P)H-hydrate dehydratase / NAD(P)H-hydrate epimerase
MQKVLTTDEMRSVDRATTEKYGIPSILLMENAANAAARVICEKLGGSVADKSILILCGRGNNGGDGAALGRILWSQGADVEVCLFGQVENTAGDARTNFESLRKIADAENFEVEQTDLAFEEISSLEEWLDYDSLNFQGDDPDVIVDALFGTGLTRPLEGVFEQAAAFISAYCSRCDESETLVVSLDVPSGVIADCGDCTGSVARSDVTVTFTAPKLANVLPPAANAGGELVVAKIGSPCDLVKAASSEIYLSTAEDVSEWLSRSEYASNSYKNKRGHALLIAGSANYSGAAVLCGNAAIRSGVGLATIATPQSALTSIAARVVPEVMVRGIAETERGAASAAAFEDVVEFWSNVDCVAIGSGLSSSDDETKEFVKKVVAGRRTPVVIDADGLNSLSPFDISGSAELPLILTPHDGEFARLLGAEHGEPAKDRVGAAREFASLHNVFLVLKGERPIIAEPGGKVAISPTGNSGLGKAGNGDTLCGVIAGFVSQAVQLKIDMFETLVAAVYFAGLAGDIAEQKYGKRAMTASDVREAFADAFELLA